MSYIQTNLGINPELPISMLLKLSSFLFWSFAYFWSNKNFPRESPEWHSRVVTLLHGSLGTVVGLSQCTRFCCDVTRRVTGQQYALMLWTWGYFAFDLLWCLAYWTENITMLIHHLIALIAATIYLNKDNTGCTFACGLFVTEVSNPLLQIRWFLKNSQYNKTKLYYVVEVAYVATFFIARGIFGTFFMIRMLPSKRFDTEQKLIGISVYVVSVIFMNQITSYVFYKYKNEITCLQDYLDALAQEINDIHS